MNEVEEYILGAIEAKREIMLFFHAFLIEEYNLRPKISYKIPMYYRNKWVVYLNPDNREGVELAFTNAHLFEKTSSLLESKDRKMVKSVEFKSISEIPLKEIKSIMKEALRVDDTFSNDSK